MRTSFIDNQFKMATVKYFPVVPEDLLSLSVRDNEGLCGGEWEILPQQLHQGEYRLQRFTKHYPMHCYLQCVDCKMVLDGCYYVFMGNFLCEKDYNVSCGCQL